MKYKDGEWCVCCSVVREMRRQCSLLGHFDSSLQSTGEGALPSPTSQDLGLQDNLRHTCTTGEWEGGGGGGREAAPADINTVH